MQWPATKRSAGDFSGLPHGDPTHCCIFDHIRHNWPEATPGAPTAKGAKYGFGGLIDLESAKPVAVTTAWHEFARRDYGNRPESAHLCRRQRPISRPSCRYTGYFRGV